MASSKVPGGGLRERPAGRIVGLDAPALQMGGDAPGQRPVRRDQSGGAARLFERLAKRDGDRLRFLGRDRPAPARARRSGGGRPGASSVQRLVNSAGAIALAMARLRAAGASRPPPQRQRSTSPRPTLIRSSSSLRWNCGWVSIARGRRPVSRRARAGRARPIPPAGISAIERREDDHALAPAAPPRRAGAQRRARRW